MTAEVPAVDGRAGCEPGAVAPHAVDVVATLPEFDLSPMMPENLTFLEDAPMCVIHHTMVSVSVVPDPAEPVCGLAVVDHGPMDPGGDHRGAE